MLRDELHRPRREQYHEIGEQLPFVGADVEPELAAAADVMLVAGRVGLVAVDSFALRLPIVSCEWPLHAPEFEYLADGVNAAIVEGSPQAMGSRVAQLLDDPAAVSSLRNGCAASADVYTLGAMVDRFCAGVLSALDAPSRGAPRSDIQAAAPVLLGSRR